jgi:hypothetical protein
MTAKLRTVAAPATDTTDQGNSDGRHAQNQGKFCRDEQRCHRHQQDFRTYVAFAETIGHRAKEERSEA